MYVSRKHHLQVYLRIDCLKLDVIFQVGISYSNEKLPETNNLPFCFILKTQVSIYLESLIPLSVFGHLRIKYLSLKKKTTKHKKQLTYKYNYNFNK